MLAQRLPAAGLCNVYTSSSHLKCSHPARLLTCCIAHLQAARMHAAARAVSGGAIYVSDKPGQHDFELLRELVLPDGSVLRGKLPGRPTRWVAGVRSWWSAV
jgi:hypothetical protein